MEQEDGSMKVNRLIEYIKQLEFPFDTHDEPEEILNHFGIVIYLDSEEKPLLMDELRKMAEQEQTKEITRAIKEQQMGLDGQWGWDDDY